MSRRCGSAVAALSAALAAAACGSPVHATPTPTPQVAVTFAGCGAATYAEPPLQLPTPAPGSFTAPASPRVQVVPVSQDDALAVAHQALADGFAKGQLTVAGSVTCTAKLLPATALSPALPDTRGLTQTVWVVVARAKLGAGSSPAATAGAIVVIVSGTHPALVLRFMEFLGSVLPAPLNGI